MDADIVQSFETSAQVDWLVFLGRSVFISNDRICQSCTDRYATTGDGQVAPDGCNEYSYMDQTFPGIVGNEVDLAPLLNI